MLHREKEALAFQGPVAGVVEEEMQWDAREAEAVQRTEAARTQRLEEEAAEHGGSPP